MTLHRYVILLLAILLGACSMAPRRDAALARAPLILVSIDGFRADYLDRGLTPTLRALADSGVHATYMRPSFPSLTFPNHYALVTGLRPDRNGIVANTMEDDRIPGQKFTSWNREAVENARWWNEGVPLWITAKRNGLHSGIMFWPGSEAPVHGSHPDFWSTYDKKMAGVSRVDTLLQWLDLPPGQRPAFMTLYLDTIDIVGHHYGPDSPELDAELRIVDATVRRLLDGLVERGLDHAVNLVVVSDHGMGATSPQRVVYLDEILPDHYARVVSYGVLTGIVPKRGHGRDTEAILLAPHEHMRCWRKSQLPRRFHYGGNRRVPPLLCLANHGWTIFDHATMAAREHFSRGEHGYDIDDPDMRALFIAHGPDLKSQVVLPPFDNVDVYPLLAHLLGIPAEPNDGDLGHVRDALIDASAPVAAPVRPAAAR
ncbi:alkaline phosphatase family protein [Dokdonella immobilis]|uniref:Predicted pyrophosphatase or phosphodiesterase, AlkP superfamily n=1 Tax=Dokdonella immobilis TaxID=578942 RepID=A0A1I4YAI1_9GAMM|nr:ectonucleotide pyrophosphatase/phosphodiesterase [Dokdonella immobilis]SFN35047.1 Predicted pyrophosphatase or phosphodiesterase, AlkP superfamily [Dokdonella immobilis]